MTEWEAERGALARRQALLAAVLDQPAVEVALRRAPEQIARDYGVELEHVLRIAALDPARIASFRRSQAHKQGQRAGRRATRADQD